MLHRLLLLCANVARLTKTTVVSSINSLCMMVQCRGRPLSYEAIGWTALCLIVVYTLWSEFSYMPVSECLFEVDGVVTWVDPSDEQWRQQYLDTAARGHYTVNLERMPAKQEHDELYFNILGLIANAPWLTKLVLVTQRPQRPAYLEELQALAPFPIRVVHHDEFIPNKYLPNFQSNVFEMFFDRIPGLSEQFLYLNDDMILLRPLEKGHFFTSTGQPIVPLVFGWPWFACDLQNLQFSCTLEHTRKVLGLWWLKIRMHGFYALTKTSLTTMREAIGQKEVVQLAGEAHRRSNVINPLWTVVNVPTVDVVTVLQKPYKFQFYTSTRQLKGIQADLASYDVICINVLSPDTDPHLVKLVSRSLQEHFDSRLIARSTTSSIKT
eukprot:m.14424 g.14424  ORF g.14424 m.14424 type:complete len:381 (-) comp10276_c0_seq1:351-1493(-)